MPKLALVKALCFFKIGSHMKEDTIFSNKVIRAGTCFTHSHPTQAAVMLNLFPFIYTPSSQPTAGMCRFVGVFQFLTNWPIIHQIIIKVINYSCFS